MGFLAVKRPGKTSHAATFPEPVPPPETPPIGGISPPVSASIEAVSAATHGEPQADRAEAAPLRAAPERMKASATVRDTVKDHSLSLATWGGASVELSLRKIVEKWPEALREEFEERAAILEYDGHEPREKAERRAYELVRSLHEAELLIRERSS